MKRVIALITVASALLLAGCSQVGAAATIGSTKITQATVQKSIDGILAERAKVSTTGMQLETGAALNRNQLRFHVISVLIADVAADQKIKVTKAEIDSERATLVAQIGGEVNLPKTLVSVNIASADFPEYIQLILNSTKLAAAAVASGVAQADANTAVEKAVIAKAVKLKISVNPQYGKWDPATGDIVATDVTSPVASPAATK